MEVEEEAEAMIKHAASLNAYSKTRAHTHLRSAMVRKAAPVTCLQASLPTDDAS